MLRPGIWVFHPCVQTDRGGCAHSPICTDFWVGCAEAVHAWACNQSAGPFRGVDDSDSLRAL